jgi:hypothetical protein
VWPDLCAQFEIKNDILTLHFPSVFAPSKDRPILFSAFAWADVLLTLDRHDFGPLIGKTFYGLPILTPGMFLESLRQRA